MASSSCQTSVALASSNLAPGEIGSGALLAALAFAAKRHSGHLRKDSGPFINHPIAVAELLARVGKVDEVSVLQAALLHDVIEDTDTPPEEVAEMFGQQVASVVQELTDDERLPKAERRRLQVERAASLSRAAQQIRIADKICNLLDITPNQPKDWDEERKREYFDWAEQVVSRCRGVNLPLETYFYEVVSQKRQAVL